MAIKEETRYVAENLFEGMVSFRTLIGVQGSEHNGRKIKKVYYALEKLKKNKGEFSYIKAKSHEFSFETELCSMEMINEMTIGTSHGGVAILTGEREIPLLRDKKDEIRENGFYFMLDGIEDPYNFGYALRSLYASGVDGIILTKRNWMSAAGVVCRSSAGASELFPMFISEDTEDLKFFSEKGYEIVCADIENSVSIYETELKKPIFVVVGGEKRGISAGVLELANKVVRLDYAREFPQALSAASASSIIAFEVLRQTKNK